MGKEIRKLFITLLLLIPFRVQALTGSTMMQCDKTSVVPGAVITCTLRGTASDGEVSAISAKIKTSGNLTLDTVAVDSAWQGNGDGGSIDLYTDSNKSNTFGIATFIVKVSNSVAGGLAEKITIDAIKFYDGNYDEVVIENCSQDISVISTINTLSGLTLSNGTLTPSFSGDTLNYSAVVNTDKVTIAVNKTDTNSTISGDIGEVNLGYGVNTFKIHVTSQSGSVRTYIVLITRPDERDKDNQLAGLLVDNNSIELIDGQTEYQYEVDNSVKEVEVNAILNSSKASFVDGFAPGMVTLNEGENKIELKVRAENEEIVTYTLTITRKSVVPSDDKGTESNQVTNPKTGMTAVYVVIGIVVVSAILVFCFYKQYQKKQVKKSNEK